MDGYAWRESIHPTASYSAGTSLEPAPYTVFLGRALYSYQYCALRNQALSPRITWVSLLLRGGAIVSDALRWVLGPLTGRTDATMAFRQDLVAQGFFLGRTAGQSTAVVARKRIGCNLRTSHWNANHTDVKAIFRNCFYHVQYLNMGWRFIPLPSEGVCFFHQVIQVRSLQHIIVTIAHWSAGNTAFLLLLKSGIFLPLARKVTINHQIG